MAIFFVSDTHFGHSNILHLGHGRPFDSIEEHNETLIDNWNSVVKSSDDVYHLGDVALGKIAESLPLVNRLNGYKMLVPGNHDRIFSGEKEAKRDRFIDAYRGVFQYVLPETFQTSFSGYDVLLSHFPYSGDSHDIDRHADKRPVDEGLPLIHGHVHDKWKHNGRMFNVGVDVNSFTPVHEDEIVAWLKTL